MKKKDTDTPAKPKRIRCKLDSPTDLKQFLSRMMRKNLQGELPDSQLKALVYSSNMLLAAIRAEDELKTGNNKNWISVVNIVASSDEEALAIEKMNSDIMDAPATTDFS